MKLMIASDIHGAAGYCTLTLDATGAITASSCWVEKLKPEPKFVLTGAHSDHLARLDDQGLDPDTGHHHHTGCRSVDSTL